MEIRIYCEVLNTAQLLKAEPPGKCLSGWKFVTDQGCNLHVEVGCTFGSTSYHEFHQQQNSTFEVALVIPEDG